MTIDELRTFIANRRWQVARTMPKHPHEYTVAKWEPTRMEDFLAAAKFINETGYKKKYGRVEFTYVDVDGYCYWAMGMPGCDADLINRAVLKW